MQDDPFGIAAGIRWLIGISVAGGFIAGASIVLIVKWLW